jgi:hypothetical protein
VKTKTLIDQLTTESTLPEGIGAMLQPLFTWRGKAVYPVFGAEGDEGNDGEPDSELDADADEDTGKGTKDESSDTVSRKDLDEVINRMKAADKRASQAEAKLKAQEDAKKDELTKATERATELEKTTAQQAKDIAELRLQNAFLSNTSGITWHDPADALALAERQGYLAEVVDDEGKVDSGKLTAKLKELAKAKPHLVKNGKDDKEDKPTGPTGSKVGTKGTGGKDEINLSRYDRLLNR